MFLFSDNSIASTVSSKLDERSTEIELIVVSLTIKQVFNSFSTYLQYFVFISWQETVSSVASTKVKAAIKSKRIQISLSMKDLHKKFLISLKKVSPHPDHSGLQNKTEAN